MTRPVKSPLQRHSQPKKPVKKTTSSGSPVLVIMIILTLLVGGGVYYYYTQQQAERARIAAQRKAQAAAKKKAAEKARKAAELAAQKAAEEKAAQEAEAKRLAEEEAARKKAEEEAEARRLAEEEEARRRAEEEEARRKEQEIADTEETVEEEPEETPAEPVKTAYDADVALAGAEASTRGEKAKFQSMLDTLFKEGDYNAFLKAFTPKTKKEASGLLGGEKLNYNAYKTARNLMTAIELCILIDYAGEGNLRAITHPDASQAAAFGNDANAEKGREFMHWLIEDRSRPLHSLVQNFMLQEGRPQNMGFCIQTFYMNWLRTPARERERYLNLSMACALISPQFANSSGMVRNPKSPLLTVPEVYDYFRQRDAARKLLTDVKKMSVNRLLMVVDLRLPRSEFEWVEKNLAYERATWASKAYNSIRYLMERAKNNKDPYTHYTFAEIRKEGGVCRDQAYFAANSAKIMGIPAVYAVGDGDRGGHAWVVAQSSETTWEQVNSYGYKTGTFTNPCSGRRHHESMLLTQTKREKPDQYAAAADCIAFSRFMLANDSLEEARAAARYVTGVFPTMTAAWSNLVEMLGQEDEPVEGTEWRKVYNSLQQQSRKNSELTDIAAHVQDTYLFKDTSVAGKKAAMDRDMRNLRRNVGNERSDLLVEAIERQASVLAEAKDVRGLGRLYRKELKSFTKRGDVFQQLLSRCIVHFTEAEATKRDWASLAKDMEKLYEKEIQSGGGDYFKLTKEVQIQKLIATLYENAENDKKAAQIAEQARIRLQNAKQ